MDHIEQFIVNQEQRIILSIENRSRLQEQQIIHEMNERFVEVTLEATRLFRELQTQVSDLERRIRHLEQ
jgi:hypothetical protein